MSNTTVILGLILLLAAPDVFGKGIAVLYDISGSLPRQIEAGWHEAARKAIVDLISRGEADGNVWDVEGEENVGQAVRLQANDYLLTIRFGAVTLQEFPYFSDIRELQSPDLTTLNKFVQESFPPLTRYSQADSLKTNKDLVRAVAAEQMRGKSPEQRIIMVSDFLEDAGLTREQIDFTNGVESQLSFEPPLILSWKPDNRLRIKVYKVFLRPKEEPPTPPDGAITLLSPRKNETTSAGPINFRWNGASSRYRLVVTRKENKGKTTVLSKILEGTTYRVETLENGSYSWYVEALSAERIPAHKSAESSFSVSTSLPWGLIFLVAIMLLLLLVFRSRIPDLATLFQGVVRRTKRTERSKDTKWKF